VDRLLSQIWLLPILYPFSESLSNLAGYDVTIIDTARRRVTRDGGLRPPNPVIAIGCVCQGRRSAALGGGTAETGGEEEGVTLPLVSSRGA